MRLATVNVNGVRAAFRNGMPAWLAEAKPDIIALQEVRAADSDLEALFSSVSELSPSGSWHLLHDEATAKGRAGVALVSSQPAVASRRALGPDDFDSAGRWLEADYRVGEREVTVVSVYVHAGEVDTPKQVEKYRFLTAMTERMAELVGGDRLVAVVGDLNVGHTELDIKNWKGNLKNAGFLPEERAYFDTLMQQQGWVDIGRSRHPGVPGPYTWWSVRGQAFDTDTGWRIDYQLLSPALAALAKAYRVDRAPSYAARWSDHAPVVVDYAL